VGTVKHECLVRPEDLGPYLLRQLDSEVEARIGALVAACPSCTEEVRVLRPVVTALGRATTTPERVALLTDTDVARPDPQAGFDGLLTAVRRERARRRGRTWRAAAAAAVVAAVLTLGAVAVVSQRDAGGGHVVALVGTGQARGSAVVSERAWGTAIVLTVRGLKPGKPYGAWLEDRSGDRVPAGTFTPASDGTVRLDLSALMSLHDTAAVGVTQLGGVDVLRYDF
jgi:anti-sigma-K factor RskA